MAPVYADHHDGRRTEEALGAHRAFQIVAARTFASGAADAGYDFTESELREEAALRSWVRGLDLSQEAPRRLPEGNELRRLANLWDIEFGAHAWWTWPA